MPNHVIYDAVWESDKLAKCSLAAAMAYPWVFLVADDHGRFEYNPRKIWKHAFSYREDVTVEDVAAWLGEYERVGLLVRYHIDLAYWYKFRGRKPSERRPSELHDPSQFVGMSPSDTRIPAPESPPSRPRLAPASPTGGDPASPEAEQSGAEQSGVEQSGDGTETEQEHGGHVSLNGHGRVPRTDEEKQEYAQAIWETFTERAGQPARLAGPKDFQTINAWMRAKIPLSVVLRGIADTKGKGSSLAYYSPSVRAAYDYYRQAMHS